MALFIRSLDIGGAERQLVMLAKGLHARGVDVRVLTFYPGGALRPELEAAGIPVSDLDKRGRWDVLPFLWRLWRWLRRQRPDVLYSWLPTANTIAAIVGRFAAVPRIVWGVRASNVDAACYDWLHRVEQGLASRLAQLADSIVCNSEAGARWHEAMGYPAKPMVVIENGIDTAYFHFSEAERLRLRREWGVGEEEVLIGLVARLDPMKDHETFLRAAAILVKERNDIRFVCVGDGPDDYRARLHQLATDLDIAAHVVWAGPRNDLPAVYSALDIASSSSSFGEGFSNAIAEAMACERPCVVTDVGDSARIVGKVGEVSPPRDPVALAGAILKMLDRIGQNADIGRQARARIVEEFSVDRMVSRTMQVVYGTR
ncbi:glycosyltransferase [Pelomicrobium methylotrophicum]|uniref:glycosyltransferase n=1 Tax=Pelomicrobium methylotrophicum TaxID=2602750 RepID=UPI001F268AD5|nr:glycosyltransferase [Pelomicrobium methylotrophicum]